MFWAIGRMMEGAGADDVPLPGPLDGCVTPRTDGILVPMRKSSRADEKKFPRERERSGSGVKTSVSLRFQSKSVIKQTDIS